MAPCTSGIECRDAFGFGAVCGDSGFCEDVRSNDRCQPLVPSDLFDNLSAYSNAYPIGVLFDHTADFEKIFATELALTEIRSRGDLDQHEIVSIQCDYQNDNSNEIDGLIGYDAVQFGMTYLAEDLGVPLVIGPAGSDDSIAAYDIAKESQTVLISPSASSPTLSLIDGVNKSDDDPGLFWRTVGPDDKQASALTEYILSLQYDTFAIVNQKSSYGEGFANVMTEQAQAQGGTVYRYPYDSIEEEAWLYATENEVDAVVFISSDILDVTEFVNDVSTRSSYDELQIFLPDSASKEIFFGETQLAADSGIYNRIMGSRPALPSGIVFDNFAASYMAFTGENANSSVYSAYSYDATWIGAYGLIWAHNQGDPSKGVDIAKGLRQLSAVEGTELDINLSSWTTVLSNFSNGTPLNVRGSSGSLDFDPDTEETENNIEIWAITNNQDFVVLEVCTSEGPCVSDE